MEHGVVNTRYAIVDGEGRYVTQDRRRRTSNLMDAGMWANRGLVESWIAVPERITTYVYCNVTEPLTGWHVVEVKETVSRKVMAC